MLRMTHSLATATLAAGLALGTAGMAAANTGTSGKTAVSTETAMSTPFENLTVSQLSNLKGRQIYNDRGNEVGKILRLVRGQDTHQLYFVISPEVYLNDQHRPAAVPVNDLEWFGKNIILTRQFRELPLSGNVLNDMPLQNFVYTGDTWSPSKA